MKKIHIIVMAVVLSAGFAQSIFGQQTPVFANYSYNSVVFNPADAGFYQDLDITLTNSGFLNHIEGSPRNLGLTINSPTGSENVGLGGGISSDQIGVSRTTSLFGAYSYKLFFNSEKGKWWSYNPHVLSFGIAAGVTIYDENLLELGIENDPNFSSNISATIPSLGVGILYNRERVYVGLSASNLLGSYLSSEDNLNIKGAYYAHAGYRFFATRFEELMINPSVLLKYVSGAPVQADLNTKINYKNKFEIGAGYRTNSSLNLLAGFYLSNHLRVLYSYNKTLKNTSINNTHGLVLSVRLGSGFVKK